MSTNSIYLDNHSPNIKFLGQDHMALAQPASGRVLIVHPSDPETVVATLEAPPGTTWETAVGTGHDECATYFNGDPEFWPSGAHLALPLITITHRSERPWLTASSHMQLP